jgi:hypothetical protein
MNKSRKLDFTNYDDGGNNQRPAMNALIIFDISQK